MASCRIRRTSYAALDPNFPQSTRSIRLQSSVGDASALHFNTCKVLKLRSDQTDSVSVDLHQQRLNGDGRLLFFGHTCDRLRSRKIKSRHSRILRHRRQSGHEQPYSEVTDSGRSFALSTHSSRSSVDSPAVFPGREEFEPSPAQAIPDHCRCASCHPARRRGPAGGQDRSNRLPDVQPGR